MNSISYLDSVLSRSLNSSRKGSGTTTPTTRTPSGRSLSGGGDTQTDGQVSTRRRLERRASDNVLKDRAATAARRNRAGFGFTPVTPLTADSVSRNAAADETGDATVWPQGDEDSSMESGVETGSSRGEPTDGFLRGSAHKKSHSESSDRQRIRLRRAGSTPADYNWTAGVSSSSRRVGSSSSTSSRSSYGWGSLWGLTGWAESSNGADTPGGRSSTASGRRRRRAGHPSRTSSSSGVSRASDVNLMSEIERENIVDFEGGEEDDEAVHLAAVLHADGSSASNDHDPISAHDLAGEESKESDDRRTSLPLALATDLATPTAKAQVESGLFEVPASNGVQVPSRPPSRHSTRPPSYAAALQGDGASEMSTPTADTTEADASLLRWIRRAFRALRRALWYLLTLPARAVLRRRATTVQPVTAGYADDTSYGSNQLEKKLLTRADRRQKDAASWQSTDEGIFSEKAQIAAQAERNQGVEAPPMVQRTQSASKLLPNPHPVENLLGHDPNAKHVPRHFAQGGQALAPVVKAKPQLTSSIIHHSPKTLILDLDETLIHSTSRSPNWAALRGGASVSTGGGLLGMDGIGDMLGLRSSTGGRLRPHMVEVVLDGRSVLYHVYKRPWVDHFLRKVAVWYNVVIFTASVQEYADPVIDWLDQGRGLITGRFFRDSCTYQNGTYLKNLAIVDADLSKVCLVDNSPASYHLNPANGIPIEGWTHDPKDEALLDLLPVLDSLRFSSDVRHILGVRLLDS